MGTAEGSEQQAKVFTVAAALNLLLDNCKKIVFSSEPVTQSDRESRKGLHIADPQCNPKGPYVRTKKRGRNKLRCEKPLHTIYAIFLRLPISFRRAFHDFLYAISVCSFPS